MKKDLIKSLGLKKESKPTAGSGNFKKMQNAMASEYEAKGKSPAEAEKIGWAIAAKIGREKYGKKAMEKAAVKWKDLLITKLASKK